MATQKDLMTDSGERFLDFLDTIAQEDATGLKKAYKSYGPSWKQRGGMGAFMMFARKWDRLENRLKMTDKVLVIDDKEVPVAQYDLFGHVAADPRVEGIIDDIRDIRRYCMLAEAELRARGWDGTHRDNVVDIEDKRLEAAQKCPKS